MNKHLYTILFAVCLLITITLPAFAQDAMYAIKIKDSVVGLIAILSTALATGLSAVVAYFFGKGKKVPVDENTAASIEAVLQGAIRIAEQAALAAAKNINDPEVKSEVLAVAANFILKQVPKLAAHFGITNENVADFIVQRLGQQGVGNANSIQRS